VQIYEFRTTRHRVADIPATIRSPRDTLPILRKLLEDRETEALAVVLLDAKLHVIGVEVAYTGNVSASLVRVGELFRAAVRLNAAAIILGHNHPSGDPTASPDDLHLTAEAVAAGRLLDIELLDHIVIGATGTYSSLHERGIPFGRQGRAQLTLGGAEEPIR
jgi:DNA repair protein RadC